MRCRALANPSVCPGRCQIRAAGGDADDDDGGEDLPPLLVLLVAAARLLESSCLNRLNFGLDSAPMVFE